MVTMRRGRTSLGCLVTLLVLVAAAYFGVNVGQVYYRYLRIQDDMRQEARFAGHNTDAVIMQHLVADADSLGLPESARNIQIRRIPHHIDIWSEYYERVELPLYVRDFYFNPHAEATF